MARYIDADKQIERYSKKLGFYIDEEGEDRFSAKCEEIRAAISALYNAPTADVVEVVHGEWIKADSMPLSAKCSECNCWITRHTIKENWFRYCPHCGAKMNKKRKWNIEIIF